MLPGRPFGNVDADSETAERFGRFWTRGGPEKERALARAAQQQTDQFTRFFKRPPPSKNRAVQTVPDPKETMVTGPARCSKHETGKGA